MSRQSRTTSKAANRIAHHTTDPRSSILCYRIKGGTNKRLLLPAPIMQALTLLTAARAGGPIVCKQPVAHRKAKPCEHQHAFRDLVRMVEQRSPANWSQRTQAGLDALKEARGIKGDDVRREFARLVRH